MYLRKVSVVCCDLLVITSTGLALQHRQEVLGAYRTDGISNGRHSYKNDNNQDRHLHFGSNKRWLVSTKYITSFIYFDRTANILLV